ncbi:3-oxoacyl-ACP synthase III family protein [Roseivirga sp. E12]|uniref:3-oxoacyl-ACP synthase III family protein n=1 Tax=Roseivirga sp. E12 TaxID=2819237 RepID=UPI001ABD3167|nr:ketoacyl-ACP synthase III [Roseivirga sp. E12]MBO3699761.1 ketoacyl-ACP synthase III [Roseivirga sp. E12]
MIKIDNIEYYLPANKIANQDLADKFPEWDIEKVSAKSGVMLRHVSNEDETALDLAKRACDQLFEKEPTLKDEVDGIVFCTQSPDHIMPSNAFLMQQYLGLCNQVLAFDYNLACSGYVYGLSIINGLISTGVANKVLLITADTYSKYMGEKDRSTRVLFSDAAAVSLISKGKTNAVMDTVLASCGNEYESFFIPAGGHKIPRSEETSMELETIGGNIRSLENIHMNGFNVWKFIATAVPRQIKEILKKNELTSSDIKLFLFHQASKLTLDSLIKALKLPESKVYSNLKYVGNTVSASIPILIKDAEDGGKLERGDLVLISGFGVGLSWGSIILRY